MQNLTPKLRQTSIISKKPGFSSEKLRAPTNIEFNIFLLKFCTCFLLSNVYKRVCGIFLFCADRALLVCVKNECVETRSF